MFTDNTQLIGETRKNISLGVYAYIRRTDSPCMHQLSFIVYGFEKPELNSIKSLKKIFFTLYKNGKFEGNEMFNVYDYAKNGVALSITATKKILINEEIRNFFYSNSNRYIEMSAKEYSDIEQTLIMTAHVH